MDNTLNEKDKELLALMIFFYGYRILFRALKKCKKIEL